MADTIIVTIVIIHSKFHVENISPSNFVQHIYKSFTRAYDLDPLTIAIMYRRKSKYLSIPEK